MTSKAPKYDSASQGETLKQKKMNKLESSCKLGHREWKNTETNDLGEFTLCLVYIAQLWHIELENWSLSVWQITVSLACLRVANFSLLARNFHTTDEICKFVLQIILTFARAGQPSLKSMVSNEICLFTMSRKYIHVFSKINSNLYVPNVAQIRFVCRAGKLVKLVTPKGVWLVRT